MISVVIPTLNEERHLAASLEALVPAAISGLVKYVIVADGGSNDRTKEIAEAAGARIIEGAKGRGRQLAAGARAARGDWLLFLHADTVLDPSWADEAAAFTEGGPNRAGVFTLKFNQSGFRAGLVARGAMVRTALFASPYGDQGLLISRKLYDAIGGYCGMPLFEDVEIIDRIIKKHGRKALHVFKAKAVTSAARYEEGGYLRRVIKNAACLAMYRAGVSPEKILAYYEK